MRLIDREVTIPCSPLSAGVLQFFAEQTEACLDEDEVLVRFAVTFTEVGSYNCELGTIRGSKAAAQQIPSVFDFRHRGYATSDDFNCMLLVPTGIGAEIGGHAGDAGPVTWLLASICDNLITHPNVVNASDINELPANGLYVEGSTLCRLLLGTAGLQKVKSNRLLVVMDHRPDEPYIEELVVNSVNAARATYGLNCTRFLRLDPTFTTHAQYSSTGVAAGHVEDLELLIAALNNYKGDYDAVAIASTIDVPPNFHMDYFRSGGEMVNPWGGVEAMLTHAISLLYDVPTAHAPMVANKDIAHLETGVVDSRMAAEAVSISFIQCIFKGLMRSPRIVTRPEEIYRPGVISARDISCLVIPEGCLGLPTLAALEQGIPVIAVKENKNRMRNDLESLPWAPGQYFCVENYWEAAGVMAALKAGIAPESVRRPIELASIEDHKSAVAKSERDQLRLRGREKQQAR